MWARSARLQGTSDPLIDHLLLSFGRRLAFLIIPNDGAWDSPQRGERAVQLDTNVYGVDGMAVLTIEQP